MLLLYLLYAWAAAVAAVALFGSNLLTRWRHRHLPGPPPSWLVGNVIQLGDGKSDEVMLEWAKRYGAIYNFYLGRSPCVVISDPELVRQVTTKCFMDYHDRSQPPIETGSQGEIFFQNNGIFIATGKYWAGVRAACEPLFHSTALASYVPVMNKAIDVLLDKLQAAATSGESTCVTEELKGMGMDVIGSTAFGVDFDAQKADRGHKLVESAEAMFKPFGGFPFWAAALCMAVPELKRFWYRVALLISRRQVEGELVHRRYLWGASQALLDSARRQGNGAAAKQPPSSGQVRAGQDVSAEARASESFQQAYNLFAKQTPPESSIVSRLKNAVNKDTGEPLQDLDICAQLFSFILAGYETSSLSLSYALYLLAKHPDHQQQIMQEVDALGQRELTYDDLAKLQYTEAVFQESMRMYPPVSPMFALSREVKAGGVELKLSGMNNSYSGSAQEWPLAGASSVRLPGAPTRVMFNIWAIHHDPKHFPQPEEFRPERFLPGSEEAANRHPAAFFPFGLGPRKCVGWRFAMEEGVLCLGRIFQRFELRLDADKHTGPLDLRTSVTTSPLGGIWLKVHNRRDGQR